MRRNRRHGAADRLPLVGLLAVAACLSTVSDPAAGAPVPLRELAGGASYPDAGPAFEGWALGDAGALEARHRTLNAGRVPPPAPPAVDFATEIAVGATLGQRSTGGHAIAFTGATLDGGTLRITVRTTSPGSGMSTIQMITSPWVLHAVPREGVTSVVWIDGDGAELARADVGG